MSVLGAAGPSSERRGLRCPRPGGGAGRRAAGDGPARWRGRLAFPEESSAGSHPHGARRPLPLGLRKAMQLNPSGGAGGGGRGEWGGTPSEPERIAPERRCRENAARSGSATRGRGSKGILLSPAGLRAKGCSALIPRWRLHACGSAGGGQPKASWRLGVFHPPPLLACPGRWGFRVPFKTNPKAFTRCGKRVAGGKQSKSEPASKLCPFSQPPELDAPCASHRPSHAEGGLCRPAGKCLSVRCHELGSVSSKKEGARGFFPHPHPFH